MVPSSSPCEGLYDLTLQLGGERESLAADCGSFSTTQSTAPQSDTAHFTFGLYFHHFLPFKYFYRGTTHD